MFVNEAPSHRLQPIVGVLTKGDRTLSKQHGCQFAWKYWSTLAGKFSCRSSRRLLYSLSLWLRNADNAAAHWLSDKFIFDVVTSRSIAHSTWNRHRSNNTWGSCWSLSAMSLSVITVLMSVQRGFLALNCLNNSWSMPWSRRFQPLHSHRWHWPTTARTQACGHWSLYVASNSSNSR